jgi:hypothetical protein
MMASIDAPCTSHCDVRFTQSMAPGPVHAAATPFVHRPITVEGLMSRLILVLVLLPTIATAAEQQKKKAPQPTANPCAQYGDGFVQIKGTTTCIKANGYIRVEGGAQTSPRR